MPLHDIIIPEDFTTPHIDKLQHRAEAYEKNGILPAAIVINDSNVLIDGYATYLTAVKYGLATVPVQRGHVELIEACHRLGEKTYFWRVLSRLQGTIQKGDRCLVRTANGFTYAKVLSVLQQQLPPKGLRLRNVIKKVR